VGTQLPDNNTKVDWIAPGGVKVLGGTYRNGFWFLPEGVYVYYTPVFWRRSSQ